MYLSLSRTVLQHTMHETPEMLSAFMLASSSQISEHQTVIILIQSITRYGLHVAAHPPEKNETSKYCDKAC